MAHQIWLYSLSPLQGNLEDPDYCLPDSCYEEAMFNARALQVIKETH